MTAIPASLCCIAPILALLSGTSELASSFSWFAPFRPYLIGLTVLLLGFAWHQKLKPQKAVECSCDCESSGKTPFIQTKKFLGITTIFAVLALAFPMYAHVFYPSTEKQTFIVEPQNIQMATFEISGMTCTGCEEHIYREMNKLTGIIEATVSYEKGNAVVEFDQTRTNMDEIEKSIANAGYFVTEKEEKK